MKIFGTLMIFSFDKDMGKGTLSYIAVRNLTFIWGKNVVTYIQITKHVYPFVPYRLSPEQIIAPEYKYIYKRMFM